MSVVIDSIYQVGYEIGKKEEDITCIHYEVKGTYVSEGKKWKFRAKLLMRKSKPTVQFNDGWTKQEFKLADIEEWQKIHAEITRKSLDKLLEIANEKEKERLKYH